MGSTSSRTAPLEPTEPSHRELGPAPAEPAELPFPFEDILAPFVRVARARLAARSGERHGLLSGAAHAALERSLVQSLSRASAQALDLEFSIERGREQSSLARLFAEALDDDDRAQYRRFVERLLMGGLRPFFQEYAVLARLMATLVDRWVDANAELLERLATDLPEIQARFGGRQPLGRVTALKPALSDPHRGRRMVVALTFESGLRLVYKPKSVQIEAAYNRLLSWLSERGAPLPLRVVDVLDRTSHGWVELVEHQPCADREQARRYFRRAGMLLALVYLLEGTDCHQENIIASGEHPVLIDLETLLHHRVPEEHESKAAEALALAIGQMNRSVLRTGLLPVWQVAANGRAAYDVSGLGGAEDRDRPVTAPVWSRVNTDRMALEQLPTKLPPATNRPKLDGAVVRLDQHVDELVDGFRQMYRFLAEQRPALLEPGSPLLALADQHVRFIHRATKVYGVILTNLFDPRYLRDGADRGIELELLARSFVQSREKPLLWPVLAAEQAAIEQIDVPYFAASAGGDGLEGAGLGLAVRGCFLEPSIDLVLARLRALSEEDLELQVRFIQGTVYTHLARDPASLVTVRAGHVAADADVRAPDGLLACAVAIAEPMRGRAIRAGDGSATWIATQYLAQAERYRFQPVEFDLYAGSGRISLFLAALARVTGREEYRDLALAALEPLRHELRGRDDLLTAQIGIGGGAGLGSVAYALTRASGLLDEPSLLNDAARAVALITHDRIGRDRWLDVVGGVAGSILGLLSYVEATGDRAALERAAACGERLVRSRTASAGGPRAWALPDGKLLTGFSHGAAGIAYALLRLYGATHEADFLAAAREGIAYEASIFSEQDGNWPDLRADRTPSFATQWCHGAAGIGLARLGGLAIVDDAAWRADLDVAFQTTRRFGPNGLDQLCCGIMGRAELLLAAGDRLDRPELLAEARSWAATMSARAEEAGGYMLHPILPPAVYDPGLFQGMAGIGYELVRLAHPELVPSVLLWE